MQPAPYMPARRANPPLNRFAKASIALEVLLGIGALGGGLVLVLAPRGEIMPLPLSALAGSPFETYLGPGLILFTVLGLGPLVAAGLAWLAPSARAGCRVRRRRRSADLGRGRDRDHRLQQRAAAPGDLPRHGGRHHLRCPRLAGRGRDCRRFHRRSVKEA